MNSKPQKILCPTDFSPLAQHGVQYALDLAQLFGSKLRLVHAYSLPTYFALPEAAVIPSAEYATARSVEHQARLDSALESLRASGIDIEGALRIGVTHAEIAEEAEQWNADLIVMSSHGHTGFTHAVLGSVAERVLRVAPCPVLILRNEI